MKDLCSQLNEQINLKDWKEIEGKNEDGSKILTVEDLNKNFN